MSLWPWKLIGRIALPLAIVAVVWWQVHAYGERCFSAGQAEVQARWDADELAEKSTADEQIRANQAAEAAAAARNKEIADAHAKELAAAAADTDRLRRLLASARAAATGSSAPAQGAGEPRAADASPPGESPGAGGAPAGSLERIDAAIADALTEARQNADQLDALLAEIRPQL